MYEKLRKGERKKKVWSFKESNTITSKTLHLLVYPDSMKNSHYCPQWQRKKKFLARHVTLNKVGLTRTEVFEKWVSVGAPWWTIFQKSNDLRHGAKWVIAELLEELQVSECLKQTNSFLLNTLDLSTLPLSDAKIHDTF